MRLVTGLALVAVLLVHTDALPWAQKLRAKLHQLKQGGGPGGGGPGGPGGMGGDFGSPPESALFISLPDLGSSDMSGGPGGMGGGPGGGGPGGMGGDFGSSGDYGSSGGYGSSGDGGSSGDYGSSGIIWDWKDLMDLIAGSESSGYESSGYESSGYESSGYESSGYESPEEMTDEEIATYIFENYEETEIAWWLGICSGLALCDAPVCIDAAAENACEYIYVLEPYLPAKKQARAHKAQKEKAMVKSVLQRHAANKAKAAKAATKKTQLSKLKSLLMKKLSAKRV